MRLYGRRYPGWVWHVVASAHLSLNVNQRLHIATLLAGVNRHVLSPQMKKPRTMARLWCSDRSNANTATYTKYIAHLFIKMQARYDYFLQFSSHFLDR